MEMDEAPVNGAAPLPPERHDRMEVDEAPMEMQDPPMEGNINRMDQGAPPAGGTVSGPMRNISDNVATKITATAAQV